MDPLVAVYTVLLAGALGFVGLVPAQAHRRGRGLVLAAVLGGFLLIAAVSALSAAQTVLGTVMTALAVLFATQAAVSALMMLWREMTEDPAPPAEPSDPAADRGASS
ncbi:hypothetical protein [Halothiobacillus sp. DCM-1]|uniref:hypothetical protein n=1 Tax=Halothiobacillus sp. DCM-1 TaxID=3112558 RepID=UPI0032523CD3